MDGDRSRDFNGGRGNDAKSLHEGNYGNSSRINISAAKSKKNKLQKGGGIEMGFSTQRSIKRKGRPMALNFGVRSAITGPKEG